MTTTNLFDLTQTLREVSQVVDNTDTSITVAAFTENYQLARKHFKDAGTEDWVKFETFDEFKEVITALVYISMIYIYSKNGSVDGVAENTGFVTDFRNAYSWWNCIEEKGPFDLDGAPWDYAKSLIEVRQTLRAGEDFFEIKVIAHELVEMKYDLLQTINAS